jgi:hypothetical protein
VKTVLGLLAVSALALSACATAPPGPRFERIFDGKSLSGWTPKIKGHPVGDNFANTFRAHDGVIAVSYDGYGGKLSSRYGHLFYKTALTGPWRLRLDYRFLEGALPDTPTWAIANSGVMIYGQDPKTMALDDSYPVSVEAQLLGPAPNQTRFTGNMCSPGTNVVIDGKLIETHCINSKIAAPPLGEWVHFEVAVSSDGTVTQTINGATSMVYSAVQLDPKGGAANSKPLIAAAGGKLMLDGGTISLQSEGNPVEFRNVELRVGE